VCIAKKTNLVVLQPNVNPGECFAFKGANAMILMGLSKKIRVTAVTMEHIPKTSAINGNIDSAPKEFSVWGYSDDLDPEPLLLGSFVYLDNNQSLQTYDINVSTYTL
jgi:Sad1 / UNC-like C-terminal